MPYKYNFNKRHDYIRKCQRKRKTVGSREHNQAGGNCKNVEFNSSW